MRNLTWIGLLAAFALLGGCGTLPDAKPFADATGSLAASVGAGGNAVADTMVDASGVAPERRADYVKLSDDFKAAWRGRVESTRATVTYADSIANLISAGSEGAETVNKVADSLASLAAAVSIPVATPAFKAATELAAFVAERVVIVRASAKLEAAMAQAQPAIDRLANLLVEDTELRLKPLLRDLHQNIKSSIGTAYEREDNYRASIQDKRKDELAKVLKDPSNLAKVQELDRADAVVAAVLQERDRKLEAAAAAYKARLQLIDAVSNATMSWAQAHRDLAAAVRDKRKVSVAELEATITELKALVKKVREL